MPVNCCICRWNSKPADYNGLQRFLSEESVLFLVQKTSYSKYSWGNIRWSH